MITFLRYGTWPLLWVCAIVVATKVTDDFFVDLWGAFAGAPVAFLLWCALAYAVWRAFRWWGRYWYAVHRAKNFVTMQVLLPREETKIDQEKRTEKDFKEKIAIMEQLYRALWEIKSLNFQQMLHFWFFRFLTVSFELYVEKGLLTFYVVTSPELASIVEKQVTAFYPNAEVRLTKTPDIARGGACLVGYNLLLQKPFMYPIRFYEQMQDDPLNGVANVLSKVQNDETVCVQLVLTPTFSDYWNRRAKQRASVLFKGKKDRWVGRIPILSTLLTVFGGVTTGTTGTTFAPGAQSGDSFVRMIQPEEELYKHMGEKAGMSFYFASIRLLASSKTWARSFAITNEMQVAFNAFKDLYGNVLVNRRMFVDFFPLPLNAWYMARLWRRRINGFLHRRVLLVEKELAALYHFPDSRYNKMPNIGWVESKVLPPPPDVPREGILIGVNRYRAAETGIRFRADDRTRHHYIIGKSGTGKSAFLSWMSRQDIQNGEGVCVVDPHGDLIEDALAHTPKARAKEVVVFDPSDLDRPMGLNLLEAKTDEQKDRASLDAMEIFIKLFGNEIFGPRIQHYFRNGCLTLMDDEEEGATLIDVPRLFVDDEFQHYKVSKCKNNVVRSFWEHEMAKTGAREKEEMIPYFSAKFGPFITNTTMRNIIGQPKSAFDIREVMDNGKVLLVNLSKGKIGDINAQLLGLIFVNKINMAALSRADVPRKERRRFYLYVDEFQNFVTEAFATILSEARKHELALIMAHQFIGQLVGKTEAYGTANTKLRDAVFGNAGTISSFKIGAEDAEYMAKEMAPVLSEQDVINVPNFQCYIKLNINNVTSRPFSMATLYDESERSEKLGALVKEYSRMKYGRKKVFVDQEIEDRIGIID